MAKPIPIFLNCTRNALSAMPPEFRKAEAKRDVKMLLVAKALKQSIFDYEIPDKLVSDEMADRFLEIKPPTFSLMPEYQSVINEIEQSYVIGNDFSALSASCVAIERLLNQARIALHKHHQPIKELWGKDATNEWYPNIDALRKWGYYDDVFAEELSILYKDVRCRYLHCGEITNLRSDALRAVRAAYRLMTIFIGFPEDLFFLSQGGLACRDKSSPRFIEFYKPYWQAE